jgi:alanine racemase
MSRLRQRPQPIPPRKIVRKTCEISSFGNSHRPTWAEISLDALTVNFKNIQRFVGRVEVCAVVKAGAYRHGAVECATALEKAGARWFGVTTTEEGVQLREAGIRGRILLMTGFWHGDEEEIIQKNLTPAVWEDWHLVSLRRSAQKLGDLKVPVHLKIDTGMARLGVPSGELQRTIDDLKAQSELQLEGIFTHLASAEILGDIGVTEQLACFCESASQVRQNGYMPRYLHTANSAAIVNRRDAWHNMVRPGISLYGYYPAFSPQPPELPRVAPVLRWKTKIISIRRAPSGQRVGYNGTFTTTRDSRIAVLPVGYADGLNRQLSSKGRVLIRGQFAPMLGRISMDLTLVDVTDIAGVHIGDEVILLGTSGAQRIDASEHAGLASTISYEVLCNISKRVPRLYLNALPH